MKLHPYTHRLATLVASATFVAETDAQTTQLVYSQNFNGAANDTTGTGLGDGSNMTDNSGTFDTRVLSSSQWGAGPTPDGQPWKALFLTPMQTGIIGNFYTPVVNQGQSVSAFSANFTLLNNYINKTSQNIIADGFSVNFGKFNNTTSVFGSEAGMYSAGDGKTGNVLSLSFYTYESADPRIELRYNGSTIATNPMDPYYNTQNPPPSSAFLPVNFSWDSNGVDVTYNGISVFSNVAVSGFTPSIDSSFAMAARTGAAYQNTFVDDIAINTTAAPFVWSAGGGNWNTAGGWTIGTAPTTNNNWIVMSGAGGNANNNAVSAIQGLVFGSNASGSYSLSGNALTVGADGIANNSSSAQTVSSNLTLAASQTFNAANAALTFNGNIGAGSNALTVTGGHNVTLSGAVSGSGASLSKTGSGKLIISGINSYTGATAVNQGSLAVNGSLGNTSVSVGSNATLQGSGSIQGSVTISSAGTLSAGNSIESLAMGTLNLQSGSNFIQEVDSSGTVGSQADLVVVNGDLNIANGAVSLTLNDLAGSWNWVNDTKFTIFNYSGNWNGGLFVWNGNALEDDSDIIIADGKGWRFNYNDTTGGSNYGSEQVVSNFVTITAIPEPTVVTLGSLGALVLLRRRRTNA